jgi:hypothetical protein
MEVQKMKTLGKFHHLLVLLSISGSILLMQSCVVYQQSREPAVKVQDIIQMSKDGVSSKDIIHKIKSSHTGYTLKADQLAKLQKLGVSDSVINYMEQTHLNTVRRDAQIEGSYNWWPGWGWGGYYYGYPYYGWPYGYWGYNWGPTIIFRDGGHYGGHGGGHRR